MSDPSVPIPPLLPELGPLAVRALVVGLLAGPPAARPQSVFDPGLSWQVAAEPQEPWLPRDCTFTGGGELVWAAAGGARPRVLLASAAPAADPVLFEATDFLGAIGELEVAAGPRADRLFTLHQLPDPTASERRTILRRYDAEAAARGAPFRPLWTYEPGTAINGPGRMGIDVQGDGILLGFFDPGSGGIVLDRVSGTDGTRQVRRVLPGTALRALEVAAAGGRVAVAGGDRIHLLEADTLEPLLDVAVASSTTALGLSADGTRLAHGIAGGLVVLERGAGGWGTRLYLPAGPDELAVQARFSADGSTLAVSWWNSRSQTDVRLQVVDVDSAVVFNDVSQPDGGGTLQNFPVGLEMTGDGRRILLALWGQGDRRPELLLVERGVPGAVLQVDLPGSPYAVALDPSGTRIASASKDTHANLFATTGTFRLHRTGEGDLALLRPPRPGTVVEWALHDPGVAVFLVGGTPAPTPFAYPQLFKGTLALDPSAPLWVLPTTSGPPGERRASAAVPATAIGLELAVQSWALTVPLPSVGATVVLAPVL